MNDQRKPGADAPVPFQPKPETLQAAKLARAEGKIVLRLWPLVERRTSSKGNSYCLQSFTLEGSGLYPPVTAKLYSDQPLAPGIYATRYELAGVCATDERGNLSLDFRGDALAPLETYSFPPAT